MRITVVRTYKLWLLLAYYSYCFVCSIIILRTSTMLCQLKDLVVRALNAVATVWGTTSYTISLSCYAQLCIRYSILHSPGTSTKYTASQTLEALQYCYTQQLLLPTIVICSHEVFTLLRSTVVTTTCTSSTSYSFIHNTCTCSSSENHKKQAINSNTLRIYSTNTSTSTNRITVEVLQQDVLQCCTSFKVLLVI